MTAEELLKESRCVAVSACLLGENCKYDGRNNFNSKISTLLADKKCIAVCPEVLGGLSIPRKPCEIKDGKVISNDGSDVTAFFKAGALKALKIIQENGADAVLLQPRSPSCGSVQIYDGNFSKRLIDGQGIFAKLLSEKGIKIIDAGELLKDD